MNRQNQFAEQKKSCRKDTFRNVFNHTGASMPRLMEGNQAVKSSLRTAG